MTVGTAGPPQTGEPPRRPSRAGPAPGWRGREMHDQQGSRRHPQPVLADGPAPADVGEKPARRDDSACSSGGVNVRYAGGHMHSTWGTSSRSILDRSVLQPQAAAYQNRGSRPRWISKPRTAA